jgi:hypothetical protein
MRGAGRRKAHCNRPRRISRIAGRQRHTATPLGVPPRRLLRPWDRFFRARARASSPSRQVSPPFTRLVQPLKAAPRSGHGRLPKAPRVHACEAWPRAPHRPSGCPSGQLSLCPTSGSPLEAPLIGQDASRISEVLGAGIGIHSQCRERPICSLRSPDASHRGALQSRPSATQLSSWPGLSRPSTSFDATGKQDVDARAEPAHDERIAFGAVPVLRSSASRRATP